jgi:phage terminase large subunit GpA-like protein
MSIIGSLGGIYRSIPKAFEYHYLSIEEWADKHRILSSKVAAEPGAYRSDRTPYLKEIMHTLSPDHPCQKVVIQKGTQLALTEILNNFVGYTISEDPCTIMVTFPTETLCSRWSKHRLQDMLDTTEVLRDAMTMEAGSKGSDNVDFKSFRGGFLLVASAFSSTNLRALPTKKLACDEIDAYEGDVGGEGDPILLAEKRTATYANKKILLISSPTGFDSRICREYQKSDQRRYHIPCPRCGYNQPLEFSNLKWTEGNNSVEHAYFQCVNCKKEIPETDKTEFLGNGEWIPENISDVAGFFINTFYSPFGWRSWKEIVADFLDAKRSRDVNKMKVWVNCDLGERWNDQFEEEVIGKGDLIKQKELIPFCPESVYLIASSVDVQTDRLEVLTVGWAETAEVWDLEHRILHGDPGQDEVWKELDYYLDNTTFALQSGHRIKIDACSIDCGFQMSQVLTFTKGRKGKNKKAFAVRGSNYPGSPLVKLTRNNFLKTEVYFLGTEAYKDLIYSRLKLSEPGPGFMHFPIERQEEYFNQLLSEKPVKKLKGGKMVKVYEKRYHRSEVLDLWVYNMATITILRPQWGILKKNREKLLGESFIKIPVPKEEIETMQSTKLKGRYNPFSRRSYVRDY